MKRISILLLLAISSSLFSQTGLIGSYPFNSNANDVSGFGNNGIVNGAILTNDRFGNPNSSYLFNGISDYIDLGSGYSYASHSFAGWFYCTGFPSISSFKGAVISKLRNTSGFNNSEVAIRDDALIETTIGTGTTWDGLGATNFATLNNWTFITFTYTQTSNKLKFYYNSVLTDSIIVLGYSDIITAPIYVGARPEIGGITDFFFEGKIDDINIYNTAISQSVVDSLYNFNPTTNINNSSSSSQLSIYPNPTTSTYSILGIDKKDFQYIQVFDLMGRLLLQTSNNTNIDLSNFDKGVYIYKVVGKEIYTGKIIKN